MKFTKMHGIGNDYVYVNCFKEAVNDPAKTAQIVSDRHFGIGSDGLILIKPSQVADFEMDMYNADGSQGSMCGNGIRCVGKYVYDYDLTRKTEITVETKSGIKYLSLSLKDHKVSKVRVDMGPAEFEAKKIPIRCSKDEVIEEPIFVDGKQYKMTGLSMGNPHAVVLVEDLENLDLEKLGPKFEHHEWFPDRINTEFIRIIDDETVEMRVWERGSGETLACGTGACAVAVACARNGYTKDKVRVKLLGGDLDIEWDRQANKVYMTGSATTVFEGEIDL